MDAEFMTMAELKARVEELEKQLKDEKEVSQLFYQKSNQLEEKLKALKELVKVL